MASILLIDDDPQVRSVLEGFLNHDGHQVVCAANGREATQLLERQDFDLMLTDIVMPDQDGFEVIMHVTLQPDRPRIIAISGGSSRLSQQILLAMASKMRIERVLAKPISYQQLSTAVTEVLATAHPATPPQAQ
ncbi:response regulator [Trichlorobacter sp.]|uniref:response regulator n=1 Tax=Trichlorobacter sp. TaxID=2911007 RepID=UPI002A364E76|nr:response regulator [Trichlorobacter sp.]MDY0384933.1 response regulator [Trichlorobacter sp.]